MGIYFKLVAILPILVTFTLLFSHSQSQNVSSLVPALYVFGDSIFDGGNRISQYPYGVDLDMTISPRATNGLTIADYIAMWLGLPLVPPYINDTSHNSTTGINFAVGGSAVQPETNLASWSFDQQIRRFRKTVFENLTQIYGKEVINHLHESLFLVSYPINDYARFIEYANTGKPPLLEPLVFSKYMVNSLAERLTTLYITGARKFVVTNVWPLGCMPYFNKYPDACNETVNDMIIPYKNSLPDMLKELAYNLDGFEYAYSDDFSFVQTLNLNTDLTGITDTLGKCWNKATKQLCPDSDMFLYFDSIHPTQAANRLFALDCFNGTTLCSPKNIMELVGA